LAISLWFGHNGARPAPHSHRFTGFFAVFFVLALPPHVASGHATHEVFGAATPAVRSAPWAVLERCVLSLIVPINFLFVKKPSSHKQTNKK